MLVRAKGLGVKSKTIKFSLVDEVNRYPHASDARIMQEYYAQPTNTGLKQCIALMNKAEPVIPPIISRKRRRKMMRQQLRASGIVRVTTHRLKRGNEMTHYHYK